MGLDADVLDARVGGEGGVGGEGAVGAVGAAGAVDGAGGAPPSISMRHAKVARGTADLCATAAMDEMQLARALEVGPHYLLWGRTTYYYYYYYYYY